MAKAPPPPPPGKKKAPPPPPKPGQKLAASPSVKAGSPSITLQMPSTAKVSEGLKVRRAARKKDNMFADI